MGRDDVQIRAADDGDRHELALLFAAVAEERDGIAAEPPVDVEGRAEAWRLDGMLVAVWRDNVVGLLHVEKSQFRLRRDRDARRAGLAESRRWFGFGRGRH
jgi:hypothetical protein